MSFEVDLACDPDSAAEARRALGEFAGRLAPDRLEDARLLVSELVTNAIRHAGLGDGQAIRLIVSALERGVRIEVCDPGRGFRLTEPDPDPARPSGWGLYLVSELSDRWGIDRSAETRVWFELDGEPG
jgi:anti-sigma regulatory factor (Ser/Thr protein kinase)